MKKLYTLFIAWLIFVIVIVAINFLILKAHSFSDPEQHYLHRILPVAESYIEQYGVDLPKFSLQDGIPEEPMAIGAHYPDHRIAINPGLFFDLNEGTRRAILVHELLHSLDPRPRDEWTERFTQYVTERIIYDQGFTISQNPYATTYLHFIFDSYSVYDLVDMYAHATQESLNTYLYE